MSLRILLVGSGGREHALAWKILQSPQCAALVVAPGNPGIAGVASDRLTGMPFVRRKTRLFASSPP